MKIEGIPGPAGYFYYLTTKMRKGFYKALADEIVSKLNSGRVLDIGTGSGNLPIEIAKRAPNLEIIGIDLSKTLIKIARNMARRESVGKSVRFEIGSAYDLKFEDSYFDMVISSMTIHHLKYPTKAFNEIYRVLKPDGGAWIYDLIRDASLKEAKQTLREMNLPIFPSIILYRFFGLKYEEYLGEIAESLKESFFKEYKFERNGCLMKIILHKI